jgi:hypothetical protein
MNPLFALPVVIASVIVRVVLVVAAIGVIAVVASLVFGLLLSGKGRND